ncbi:MAG: phosphate/phosphite/phosphonate ABC transporter substrate-binding protein [Caulobacterales bacterium]|nr:phosphate/phosphite/phosphonate ABC transporter substrate-binding protein [Caulobacterales bacterium]
MIRQILRRTFMMSAVAALALTAAACGEKSGGSAGAPQELVFSVQPAEGADLATLHWTPLIEDLSRKTGLKVTLRLSPNYTTLVQAMAHNQTQLAWFSALPAVEAINRADAEVFARTVDLEGRTTYTSVILARKGKGLTIEKLMACDKTLTFGIGDAKSTSGTLAPKTFLFNPKGVTPENCFKQVRSANHQANMLAVANGLVDAATNNSTGLNFYRTGTPEAQAAFAKTEVIWESPTLPESAMLYRKDLDPAVKEKLRQFFLTYGTATGPEGDKERANLQLLKYSKFEAADDAYLAPIIEMVKADAAAEKKAQ